MGFFSGVKKFAGGIGIGQAFNSLTGKSDQGGIPQWVSDAGRQNYDFAKQIANRPYTPYTGQRVAQFTPGQTQGLGALNALGGSGQGLAQRGFDILGGIGSAADRIGAYQNPFTNEVINRSLSDLERQRQTARTQDQAKAVAAKAYGGSRQGIADAATNEAYARQAGDLAANLRYQGFNTALGAAQQDVQQQQALAQALQGAGYGALQGQLQAGGMEQGQNQANLDQAYAQFREQQDYPLQQLGILQSALGQTPYNIAQPGPDRFSQLLQLGTTVGGLAALSDRNMKKNIKPAKGTNILSKLDSMPVSEWEYKDETGMGGKRHIGTMAQDFAKQFGGDGKTIDIPTAIGTNLLGIQALNKKVKKLEAKNGKS